MKKALICGSRDYTDHEIIRVWIEKLMKLGYDTIIEGEAKGADIIARNIATELGLKVEKFPANWKEFGRAAGPIRNAQMLREGNPDIVIAFSQHFKTSKGTKNMVHLATKKGVNVILIGEE
jgi:hypothetical protein